MSYIILCITIVCIVGSALWKPGSIVLLDYIITPHAIINWYDPLIFPVLHSLSSFFGPEIISKVFFISILLLGAYLGVLFARWIAWKFEYRRYLTILEVFGGIFFIINPFIYERMMVQPTIALGIFLLGYVMYFLFFVHRIMIAGVFAGLAFVMMPHASFMLFLIFGLYIIFFVRSWRIFGFVVIASLITLGLNLNWLVAPYFGYTNSVATISSFSYANLEAFRTQALAPLEVWSTNILLYGFWGERYSNHYVNVGFLSSLWFVAGFLLIILTIFGLYSLSIRVKGVISSMIIIGGLSLIFGIGIASSLTAGLANWMIENIPLWQGYREPQKWIGLLMIVEGIGFLIGFGYFLKKWGTDLFMRVSIIISTALIVLIWTPGPLIGYHGQLRTTVYPESFESFRSELIPSFSGKILALPWHSYIGCSWINRSTISNPIVGLIAPLPIVSSDNIEVGDILYSNSGLNQSRDIEIFIQNGDISLLRNYNFTHIFLMRSCASSTQMELLMEKIEQSGSLLPIKSDSTYRFYQIQ